MEKELLTVLFPALFLARISEVAGTGVISDGQQSIRKAVQPVLPDVPHQLCLFHYLREAAKPVYEADRRCAGYCGYPFPKMHRRWRKQHAFLLHLHFGKMALELLMVYGLQTS
jgi:hypothetical protein